MTAITAITAQNTLGVTALEVLSPALVTAQIDACVSDIGVDAVKIGMLGSAAIAHVVADRLQALTVPIVFDPVMIATSGAALADADTIAAFERLMRIATLTTPNVPELAALGGESGMAARGVAYLAKGGDAQGDVIEDRLVVPGIAPVVWTSSRIATRHTHGTGCTLASAIATALGFGATCPDPSGASRSEDCTPAQIGSGGRGSTIDRQARDERTVDQTSLVEAISRAREFVHAALVAAPGLGAGHGPIGHHGTR